MAKEIVQRRYKTDRIREKEEEVAKIGHETNRPSDEQTNTEYRMNPPTSKEGEIHGSTRSPSRRRSRMRVRRELKE